jgi:uncharacterized membrane protein YeiH
VTVTDFSPAAFEVLDVGGVIVAAILGGMVARERHFDLVGFMALAIMAALGGGMLRDVLLQQGPPVALTNPHYLTGALAGAGIAFLVRLRGKWWSRLLVVADAFVLGSWSATGAVKTLEAGLGVAPAVMLGVITAVGGGMIRDIAVGRTPAIFGGNTLYATCALVATIPAILLWRTGHPSLATISAAALGGVLCIAARWFKWRLPENNDYSVATSYARLKAAAADYARARERAAAHSRRRRVGKRLVRRSAASPTSAAASNDDRPKEG